MNNKPATLGEVAYHAYCQKSNYKSLATGADLPMFENTKPEIQDAWEAAAQAVAQNILPDGIGAVPPQPPVDNDHVAEGAEKFSDETIAANKAA